MLVVLTKQLNTIFLNIADEDDESIVIADIGVRLPSLLGVFDYRALDGLVTKLLEIKTVVVEPQDEQFILVYAAPIKDLVSGSRPCQEVLKVLRSRLARSGYS